MAYGTPTKSEYGETEDYNTIEKRRSLQRRNPQSSEYNPQEKRVSRASRAITGIKNVGHGALREAHGFVKEVRTEGIRSGYKTQRTLQSEGRKLRRAARQPRIRQSTGIIRHREVMPGSPSLGQRAVIEASANYVPHLDRDYFGTSGEQRDLIGQGARDMSNLINTAESNLKKKEQRYY